MCRHKSLEQVSLWNRGDVEMLALEGGAVTDLQQLINKPRINYRPGGNIQELPLSLRQAVSAWIRGLVEYDECWTQFSKRLTEHLLGSEA